MSGLCLPTVVFSSANNRGDNSHPFDETIDYPSSAGLFELDGKLVPVDLGNNPIAKFLMKYTVPHIKCRLGAWNVITAALGSVAQRSLANLQLEMLEVVGESMGLSWRDRYKELKLMQDADQIVAECHDLIAQHSLDAAVARSVIAKGMLGDQPLPLK